MDLWSNPFYILGASVYDDRTRIQELAEEKLLRPRDDERSVREARAILLTPSRRLKAEVSWLLGVQPEHVAALIEKVRRSHGNVPELRNVPALARANLLATCIKQVNDNPRTNDRPHRWIVALAEAYGAVGDESEIANEINRARREAGMRTVLDDTAVRNQLISREDCFADILFGFLDLLPSRMLVNAASQAVDEILGSVGSANGQGVIHKLMMRYERGAQDFCNVQQKAINTIIEGIRAEVLESDRDCVAPVIGERLKTAIRDWAFVSRPIMRSYAHQGLRCKQAEEVCYSARRICVELAQNSYRHLEFCGAVNSVLRTAFAASPQLADALAEDQKGIEHSRREVVAVVDWKKEITYEAKVGVFRRRCRISPEGFCWAGTTIPLERIRFFRWGGTEAECFVAVGDGTQDLRVNLRDAHVMGELASRIWKAVGVRILHETIESLRIGKTCSFGSVGVYDGGVVLLRKRFWRASERVVLKWSRVLHKTEAGILYLSADTTDLVSARLAYADVPNLHVLGVILEQRANAKVARVSEAFPEVSR